MRVVHINGKDVVVGLSWRALSGLSSERKEISLISKDLGSRHGVIVRSDDVTAVGFSTRGVAEPSAAAWLASAAGSRSLILAEDIGGDDAWVCIIRDGAPMAGFDIVCSKSSVTDLLVDFVASGGYEFISNIEGVNAPVNSNFGDMVSGVKPVHVGQVSGVSNSFYIGLVALAVVACSFYFYTAHKNNNLAIAGGQKRAAISAEAKRSAEAAMEAARTEAIKSARELAAAALSTPSPVDQIESWRLVIDSVPLSTSGWSVNNFSCSSEKCVVTWFRTPYGTISGILSDFKKRYWKIEKWSSDEILVSFSVASGLARTPSPDASPLHNIFNAELVTETQRVRLAGVAGEVAQPPPIPDMFSRAGGELAKSPPDSKSTPLRIGTFSFSGARAYEPGDVAKIINLENIVLSSINVWIDADKLTWKIEGKYVVK